MPFRLEFLQTARQAPRATSLDLRSMSKVLRGTQDRSGAFAGSAALGGAFSHTAWAFDSLKALHEELPVGGVEPFLMAGLQDNTPLPVKEFAALTRCWLHFPKRLEEGVRDVLLKRYADYSNGDGFFDLPGESKAPTMRALFWGLAAGDALSVPPPAAEVLARALDVASAETLVDQARGVFFRRTLNASTKAEDVGELLESMRDPHGGFRNLPDAVTADIIATAYALFLRAAFRLPMPREQRACHIDFLEAMHVQGVGFSRDYTSKEPDPEAFFHALMALGHLA